MGHGFSKATITGFLGSRLYSLRARILQTETDPRSRYHPQGLLYGTPVGYQLFRVRALRSQHSHRHDLTPFDKHRYPSDGSRRRDAVPITARQLEALIRLSQARAKACLRDFVLKEDALDVVELMSHSVDQVHSDDYGNIDRGRGGAGGTSKRKMKRAFLEEVRMIIGSGNCCSLDDYAIRFGEGCWTTRI